MDCAPTPPHPTLCRGYSLRRRLSAIIGFLALLPVCAVVAAGIELRIAAQDNAALDVLMRGAMHLERLNGLVYDVVMESRGIYMSPDWQTAEKFGRNIPPALAEMQRVAARWKEEATAAQQSNVEELGRRVDQFVTFRTELVRLGKEVSTAAARAWGDNDANRNVRTGLNQSLQTLARAYQNDIALARGKVEANDRKFLTILLGLAALAGVALLGALILVERALMAPLLRLKDRMLRLADGDLDTCIDRRESAAELADMARSLEIFRSELVDRRRLNREAQLLSALNEWLQSCDSLSELYNMVEAFLAKLLPNTIHRLFIYANSRDVLESAKSGGGENVGPTMHPEDCWALRRGRIYAFGENEIDFPCTHVGSQQTDPYCCIPILAHGETIGLLHLAMSGKPAAPDDVAANGDMAEARRLGSRCAEEIGLTIANVKLRDQLRDQSIRDPLTGLFNRRYLLETGRREVARAARTKQQVALLSIDVDHFKQYNDEHGHEAGDTVLRALGGCLQSAFRSEDVPCRTGGEEFIVILPGSDLGFARRRAEQLRTTVESLMVHYRDRDLPRITISLGVAIFPDSGDSLEGVMRAADEAMYRAKAQGRNRVETAASAGDGEPAAASVNPAAPAPAAPLADAADG